MRRNFYGASRGLQVLVVCSIASMHAVRDVWTTRILAQP